ncbi:uncharacterized protein ACWYII_020002 isoform 3-T6 [Salvelinus alpinus]
MTSLHSTCPRMGHHHHSHGDAKDPVTGCRADRGSEEADVPGCRWGPWGSSGVEVPYSNAAHPGDGKDISIQQCSLPVDVIKTRIQTMSQGSQENTYSSDRLHQVLHISTAEGHAPSTSTEPQWTR